jgi:hypothetical protein
MSHSSFLAVTLIAGAMGTSLVYAQGTSVDVQDQIRSQVTFPAGSIDLGPELDDVLIVPLAPALQEMLNTDSPTFTPNIAAAVSFQKTPSETASRVAMYTAFGVLQYLDVHSTLRAQASGGVEGNPIIRPFASSTAGLVSLKVGSTAGMVYLMERLRKKNPTAALVFAIAANSMLVFVVDHNYRIARR